MAILSKYEIFNNFNSEQNIYFGRYGNANPLYIKDWLPMMTSSPNFLSQGVYFDTPSNTCNLPTITQLTIFYSKSGSTENLQNYIVGVEKAYSGNTFFYFSFFFINEF